MRFGARILFEEVTTTFLTGRRYAITGPNGAGKSTLMKILTGELEPSKGSVTRPKKLGILRQDQFAFDEFRVVDTVIMGNAPLWDALQQREILYAKDPDQLTDEDGSAMRAGTRRRRTPPFCSTGWIFRNPCTSERWESCRAARRCGSFSRRRCSEIRPRCCSMSRPTTWILIRFTGCRIIFAPTKGASSSSRTTGTF